MTTRAETATRREAIRAITEEIGTTQLGNVYNAAVERGIVTGGGAGYSIVQCDLLKLGIGQVCKRADGTRAPVIRANRVVKSSDGPLRRRILQESGVAGMQMRSLAVLGEDNDPYLMDTPASHRDARWLVDEVKRLGVRLPIHARGIHYAFVASNDVVCPWNGATYTNSFKCWESLNEPINAARWLGYIAWSDIVDERNAPPEIALAPEAERPIVGVQFDINIEIPDDAEPVVYVTDFEVRQPYQLYLIGEKTSLGAVLRPLAERFKASLVLPTGEISTTLVHDIAEHMQTDGRPAVIFYFSDFDPSGRQMPVSVSRKLQAFRDLMFPNLSMQMFQIALTIEQVREFELPSSPLKETEFRKSDKEPKKRGDRWRDEFGQEQTEIDALATLQPELLTKIGVEAISPWFDATLARRCATARAEHKNLAQDAFDEQVDDEMINALRERAEATLDELREKVEALREEMRDATDDLDLDLPEPVLPEPEVSGEPVGDLIYDSNDNWSDASLRMRERKGYGAEEE